MIIWLKMLVLFRLLILEIQFKNLPTTQKLKKLKKKIPDHDKFITTNDLNKISCAIFDGRLKKEKLPVNNDLNTV